MNWRLIVNKWNSHPRKSNLNGGKEGITEDFQIFFGREFAVDTDKVAGATCRKPRPDRNGFSSASVFNLDVILIKAGSITPVHKYSAALVRSNM
jgi:hypothetical protein